jgi:DNA-binding PadR family transcriptional regulator
MSEGGCTSLSHVFCKKTAGVKGGLLEEKIVEKHVKAFLDIVVLAMLNGKPMYGYKLIAAVHREFGVLLSPGSLYPLLHSLEDNKLIESSFHGGKIVYETTYNGKKKFKKVFMLYKAAARKMQNFIELHGIPS